MCHTSDECVLRMVTFCDLILTWSWPWPGRNIKYYSVRSFPYRLGVFGKSYGPKLLVLKSTTRNPKDPDFDLWPELDLTRDFILKI